MKQQKATLAEMAEAIDTAATKERVSLSLHYARNPTAPPDAKGERNAFVLESAVNLLTIMATFEEDSRKFVGTLVARHQRDNEKGEAA